MTDNPMTAYAAANPAAKAGDSFTIGGQSYTFSPTSAAAEKAAGAKIASPAASKPPPNKKVPESAAQTKSVDHPVYLHMITDVLGRMITTHANPNKPKDAFESTVNHDGTFHTKEVSDSHKGLNTSHTHHERSNAGSSSKNNDGPVDGSAQGTKNSNVKGDSGGATGGTSYKGATKEVGGTAEGSFTTTSGGKTWENKESDWTYRVNGKYHIDVKDDYIAYTYGNRNEIVVGGEYGVHTQGAKSIGLVSQGKDITLNAGKEITLEAGVKITLKVGSSTIVITPSDITITSAAVKFEKA